MPLSLAKEVDVKDQEKYNFQRRLLKDLAIGLNYRMIPTNERELSNDMSLYLSNHGKHVQNHNPGYISTRLVEPPAKGETFDVEYCPPTSLNYNLTLDKTIKNQACIKEKMHHLSIG